MKIYPKSDSDADIKKARVMTMKEYFYQNLTTNLIKNSAIRKGQQAMPNEYIQFVVDCFMFHNNDLTSLIIKELMSEASRKMKDMLRHEQRKGKKKTMSTKKKQFFW